MPKFAHIEPGFALDPHESDSAEAYLKRFTADSTKEWLVVEVPNGTEHGAKDSGGGTFTNPAPVPAPVPAPESPSTTKQQILDQIAALNLLADKLA